MNIQIKLTFKDYLRLMLALTYKKIFIWFMTIIGSIVLLVGLLSLIGAIVGNETSSFIDSLVSILIGLVFTAFIPFLVYLNAKRSYSSNAMIKENIIYEFNQDSMKLKGESFSSEVSWDSIFKVEEIKEWILIYQSKVLVTIIPKNAMNPDQIAELKGIFTSRPGIKIKFK